MIRCKARRKNIAVIGRAKTFANQDAELARFDLRSNHFLSVDSSGSNSLLPSHHAVIPSEARNLSSTLALAETPLDLSAAPQTNHLETERTQNFG
jgi:hypothetical protein